MTNLASLTNGGDGIVTADSVPTLPPGIVFSNFGIKPTFGPLELLAEATTSRSQTK